MNGTTQGCCALRLGNKTYIYLSFPPILLISPHVVGSCSISTYLSPSTAILYIFDNYLGHMLFGYPSPTHNSLLQRLTLTYCSLEFSPTQETFHHFLPTLHSFHYQLSQALLSCSRILFYLHPCFTISSNFVHLRQLSRPHATWISISHS